MTAISEGRLPEERGQRVPVPRYRPVSGLPILAQGFRPFFLLAGLWAPLALALFLATLSGSLDLPMALEPLSWHQHEMLFGFAGAALAGFLLTAIPNWTGRLPLQGAPLLGLVALWLLARLAMAFGAAVEPLVILAAVLAFPAVLLIVAAREIVAGRTWRNLPLIAALAVFMVADGWFLADARDLIETTEPPDRLGIAVFVALISLIGGRIVPSFTHTWLKTRGATSLPPGFTAFDRIVLLVTLMALIAWVFFPGSMLTAALTGLAALAQALRLSRWQVLQTLSEPLLWVLHLGYGWLAVGLALASASSLFPEMVPPSATVHAITAGAMGTMILAVMSRATLGHTGRPLQAGPALTLAYGLVTLAALARIGAALFPELYDALLTVASAAWIGAFVAFLTVCGPMLLAPRPTRQS